MHPRLSISHVSFPDQDIGGFVDVARSMNAPAITLTSPALLEPDGLARARNALGHDGPRVESLNHRFAGYPNIEADTGQAIETMTRLLPIAAELGAKSIYMGTGGRGNLEWEEAADRFAEMLAPAVSAADDFGLDLLIETASSLHVDTTIVHSLHDTVQLAEIAGIGICHELFYTWTESGLKRLFQRSSSRCGLVQVSDYVLGDRSLPARAVPGDGAMPLEHLIGTVLSTGYSGMFDIEICGPRIDAEGYLAAATRAAANLGDILDRCGA